MPRKGMGSMFFSPRSSLSSQSPSSSPSRFGFSPSRPNFSVSVMDRTLEWAEPIILRWDTNTTTVNRVASSPFSENRRGGREFIKAVNSLQRAMHLISDENTTTEKMNRAQNLMSIAMKRLQKEFYQILSTSRAHLDPESVSIRSSRTSTASSLSDYGDEEDDGGSESISEVEDVSYLAMADLRSIAECMISAGYAKECLSIYTIIRKSIVDEGIYKLGVEKITSSQMHKMDWSALDLRIRNWIQAAGTAVKTLFNGERILCDHVFASSDSIRESCFTEVTRDGAMILFGFPENVAKNTKKAALKAFRILDMYAAISNYWPEIDSIFSFESTKPVKSQAITSLIKLGEFARAAIDDFESVIQKDSSKTAVPGAGIHDLTVDAMEYLMNLSDYSNILTDILADSPSPSRNSLPESYFQFSDSNDSASPLSHKVAWLILVLLCKLDSKSQLYKDASLSYLFLANNLRYAVVRVQSSNLRYLLGEGWLANHEAKVMQFASNYERLGWGRVIDSIQPNPTAVHDPEKVKEIFQKFNASFDQAFSKQSSCVVPDNSLRDTIKISIAKKLFRLYRDFYNSHREGGRYYASIVRYTPEDVGHKLSDLFFGGIMGAGSYSSVSSSPSPSRYSS